MAITGSPDIFVSEQDLSTFVGSFDVTTAALVGDFEWGPVDQVTRITNEARLKTYFGLPSDRNFKDWFTAKNYLEYSNSLALVRVCLDSARNAYFKPSKDEIPTWDTESENYIVSGATTDEDAYEKSLYSPLSGTPKNTNVENKKQAIITNFPSYVAYFNKNNQYTVERGSANLYKKFGASAENILDLGCEISNETFKKIDENLASIKLGSAYACIALDSNGNPVKDSNGNVVFFYIRKKFEDKVFKIMPGVYQITINNIIYNYNKISFDDNSLPYKDDFSKDVTITTGTNTESTTDSVFTANKKRIGLRLFNDENSISTYTFYVLSRELDLNVKNTSDYLVQEQSVAEKEIPIFAKYPGVYGNRIHVSVINKPAYEYYVKATNGLVHLDNLDNITRNKAVSIIGQKNLADDAIVVCVSLYDPATGKESEKEYGIFSLTPGSTDITGYDNYVFNFFSSQSNYVYFNKGAFEKLFGEVKTDPITLKKTINWEHAFINIDTMLENGIDYDATKLSGNTADYSDVTTTISNGVDYEINTQTTAIVTDITDKTPLINIVGGVGAYMKGWDLFKSTENTTTANIDLLMQGGGTPEIGQYIIDLAELRKDCLACVSPNITECVNVTDPADRIAEGTGSYYSKSSYAFMDGNYKYQYDNYNDVYRWMPLNGDTAGLCAYIDGAENPWMSIGGRQIRNCIKLAFYPSKADRDLLFEYNVNSVTNFSNEGNVIWGDWTRVDNTAFNFLGVRRMFLYVEKNIKQFARTIMFKQNDQITRDAFVLAVTPFLDAVVGGRGIQEYGVFAGSDVTSPEEMDRGIFRAKFAIKPVRSIRYVDLVFVAIRSDMSVSEVIE